MARQGVDPFKHPPRARQSNVQIRRQNIGVTALHDCLRSIHCLCHRVCDNMAKLPFQFTQLIYVDGYSNFFFIYKSNANSYYNLCPGNGLFTNADPLDNKEFTSNGRPH